MKFSMSISIRDGVGTTNYCHHHALLRQNKCWNQKAKRKTKKNTKERMSLPP
jgi:hypothetical protein